MADDIKIVLQVVGDKDIVKTTKSLERMELGVRKLSKDLDKGRISEAQYNTGLKELRRTVDSSFKSWQQAKGAVDRYSKSLKQARLAEEATKNTQALDAMRRSYDRNYAVEQKTLRLKTLLRQEIANGNMTVREAGAELLRYRKSLISANQAQMAMTKASNRMGVVTQQAGYQIGDFLVQVQSGTNPMVAFGQQATQLVGILPLMTGAFGLSATALVGLSAGLGIAIPLVTAIGSAFLRSSGSAETLLQSLDKLEETNNRLRAFGEEFGEDLVGNIDAVRESFGNLVADVYEAQLNQVQNKLSSAFSRGAFSESFAASYTAIKPSELSAFDQESINRQAQQELAIQEQLNTIIGQTITSKSQLNTLFNEAYDTLVASDVISEDGLKRLQEIAIQNGIVVGIEKDKVGLAEDLGEQLMSHIELHQKHLDKQKKARNHLAEEVAARHQNIILLELERQYGKDSVEYRAELVRNERDRLQALYGQDEAAESLVQQALALYKETLDVNAEIDASANSAKGLAEALKEAVSAMESLQKFSDSLDKKLAVSVAKVEALKSGTDATIAGSIAGLRIDLDRKISDAIGSGVDAGIVNRMFAGERQKISQLEASEKERIRLQEANRPSSGGGGGQDNEKYLENLLRETKLKAQLVGVSEQEATKLKLLNTLEEKGIDLNDDRVKTLIEEQKNLAELEKAYEDQQQTVGLFKDTLTNALMSIVDGSKSVAEAFKNMMRQIISSLAQKNFIQPLVSGLTGGLAGGLAGGAAGGAAGGLLAGTGLAAGASALGSGLFAGGATALGFGGAASVGTATAAATGAMGTAGLAIGAVAAPLLAVAAVFSFFKTKTKELDSGIRATVNNMDSYIETFRVIEKKKFFGLSKKVSTNTTAMDADNPVSAAIASVQKSIFNTAEYLGIATDSLNGFSYEFELSLKGLSEEARMQKITEEVNKLSDAFAGLLPNVQNMQHLTDIMDERYSLETRLLEAQGDTEALRARELESTSEYNRSILEQIFAAEDAKAAMDALNNSIKETDFATLLDFNRAQAYARLGMNVANSPEVPSMSSAATSGVQAITSPMNSTSAEVVKLRSEMKEMHKEAMFAYSKLIKNGKDSRDTLRSWDVIGLPAERTA